MFQAAAASLVIFLKLGWVSVLCVFLSYVFMPIMFPAIFALGIFGLGAQAKKASAFIVPRLCFMLGALYGYIRPGLSKAESMHVDSARMH